MASFCSTIPKPMTYDIVIKNGRTYYQCFKCKVFGNIEETIASGFCHKKTKARNSEDLADSTIKKKEMKYKARNMGTSIKKFNKYFED